MAAGFGAALFAGAPGRKGLRGELAAPLLAGFCAGSTLSQEGSVASCAAAAEFSAAEGLVTGGVLATGGLATGGVLATGGLATGSGVLEPGGGAAGGGADFLASRAGSGFSSSVSRLFFPTIRRGRVARGRETIGMGMSSEIFPCQRGSCSDVCFQPACRTGSVAAQAHGLRVVRAVPLVSGGIRQRHPGRLGAALRRLRTAEFSARRPWPALHCVVCLRWQAGRMPQAGGGAGKGAAVRCRGRHGKCMAAGRRWHLPSSSLRRVF